jgi:NADPH:quinone reductase-like Zn-dependent oxidoreductase
MSLQTTRALRLATGFGLDKLSLDEVEVPNPGPGQVLVRVHAVSLNFRDLLVATGKYNPKQRMPLILCSDGAGEVVAAGPDASRFQMGDRVAGIFMQKWLTGPATRESGASALGGAIDGMLTGYRVLDEEGLVAMPEQLSYEQAATLPCAAVTAWNALTETSCLRAGDTVLVLGTGGVSVFAIQFAKAMGARIIVTSSSDEKLARAREAGATDTINYNSNPEWEKEVFRLTDKRGVDCVVEVGGAGTLPRSIRSLRVGGHIAVIGNLSGLDAQINLGALLPNYVNIHGIYVGSRDMFEAMNRAICLHKITPVIDRTYPLADWRSAFELLQSGKHFGKVVLRLA